MTKKRRITLDAIQGFEGIASYAEGPAAIESFLLMASRMPRYVAVREFVVYHKKPMASILNRRLDKRPGITSLNSSFPVYRIHRSLNKETKYTGTIAILPGSRANISRIVSVCLSGFWDHVVRRAVKRILYPDAIPIYFRQEEIAEALFALEASLPAGVSIHLSDVTSREERSYKESKRRKDYDTHRVWTDAPWRDVFQRADERGRWFTGLQFKIGREINGNMAQAAAVGRINKHGELHFDAYYSLIRDSILRILEQRGSERLSLLEDRGIRERQYKPSEPIEIVFPFDAFKGTEDIRDFGNVMKSYPNSAKAVYHSNPYYHANIADFLDGSSFEMWVLSTDRIMIVPQAKSSAQAFERLISYVFSRFNEGVVNVYASSSGGE